MHKIFFYNKFIIRLYMFRAICDHHQEVKIVLYSIWYHHTETSEWSKITKIQFCKYEHIVVKFMNEFFGRDISNIQQSYPKNSYINFTTVCSNLQNCISVILDHSLA